MFEKIPAAGGDVEARKAGGLRVGDALQVRVDDARTGRREIVPVDARVAGRPGQGFCRAGYGVGEAPDAEPAGRVVGRDHRDHVVLRKRVEVRERYALPAPEAAAVLKRRGGDIYGIGAERTAFTGGGQGGSGIDLPFDPDGTDPAPDTGEGLPAVLEGSPPGPDLANGEHDPSYSDWRADPIKPCPGCRRWRPGAPRGTYGARKSRGCLQIGPHELFAGA